MGQPDYASLVRIGAEYPPARPLAALLEVTLVSVPAGDMKRSRELLTWLFRTGYDPVQDDFVKKYLPAASFTLPIADGINVQLPPDRSYIGLLLGEIYQVTGDLSSAIEVVEQLEPSTVTAVSLAELYAAQGRWQDVVELTEALTNADEASTYLLTQRGVAFREQGYFEAARESFREALRIRSRPADLRHRTLLERGLTYMREGKRSMARKDFERVLAENSSYPGLRDLLSNTQD
ncbi:tetratricopeptide repeat protein [Arthrobacter koreensis]|uniref:tetratricopeptide repeat protein n=1 Tax=Arthrobacter koreensis TaxID=199136 RepID=UPI0036DDBF7A